MISLLVVNYRSSDLAAEAIRSARSATTAPLEVIAVDNSCDQAEADALRAHADLVLAPRTNLGYAGGINLGRGRCSGDVLVVSNPDVIYAPGSIDALASSIEHDEVSVAGPALYWDDAHRWMLPPADLNSAVEKLGEAIASRSERFHAWRDRRRFRDRLRFWSASQTLDVKALSGAVMAIRAADFDSVGGFDTAFQLYFEESDFLRRIARGGRRIAYVPSARCRHLYNQSAGGDGVRAAELYAQSEMRYLAKWSGRFKAGLLARLMRPRRQVRVPPLEGPMPLPNNHVVVEASPLSDFATAAGCLPEAGTREIDIPSDVWAAYRSEVLYVRAVDASTGRPLATFSRCRS